MIQHEIETLPPVMDELHHVAAFGQALAQIAGGFDIVLDDQNVHGSNLGEPAVAFKVPGAAHLRRGPGGAP